MIPTVLLRGRPGCGRSYVEKVASPPMKSSRSAMFQPCCSKKVTSLPSPVLLRSVVPVCQWKMRSAPLHTHAAVLAADHAVPRDDGSYDGRPASFVSIDHW
eukprot:1014981-Prymnesium_polylepis.2